MSNRTSTANKAIREAWRQEKSLVQNGYGTRDWTPKQQIDILTKGKAYDSNGKAFEGHHMKSAEAHPESQGISYNIQFLSRKEHLSAHYGNFRRPTDGFYNVAENKTNYSVNRFDVPFCEFKQLSHPLMLNTRGKNNSSENMDKNVNQESKKINNKDARDLLINKIMPKRSNQSAKDILLSKSQRAVENKTIRENLTNGKINNDASRVDSKINVAHNNTHSIASRSSNRAGNVSGNQVSKGRSR